MSVQGRAGLDEPSRAEMARARWRRWAVVTAVMVVGAVLAVLLAPALPSSDSGAPVSAWRADVAWVLIAVGLVLLVLGVVVAVRAGMYSGRYGAQMRRFSSSQRRLAGRCVRRGRGAPHEVQAAAVLFAQALVRQRGAALIHAAVLANTVAVALDATNPGWVTFEAALALLTALCLVTTLVRARTATRWLLVHAPSTSSQALR